MPTIHTNYCKTCGILYSGRGKFYCSNKCSAIIESPKKSISIGIKTKKRWDSMEIKSFGYRHTQEFKNKMSQRLMGDNNPSKRDDVKNKLSKENCHLWRGGITDINKKIRNSSEYKEWRGKVFERDKYTCVLCGLKSGKGVKVHLHADHIKQFSLYPELRLNIDNGRTLCSNCHYGTDTFGSKGRNKKLLPFQISKQLF